MSTTHQKSKLRPDLADPKEWSSHFMHMNKNNTVKRGKRVMVQRGGGGSDRQPVIRMVTPAQQSVEIAKAQVKEQKEACAKTSKGRPCQKRTRVWERRTKSKQKKTSK